MFLLFRQTLTVPFRYRLERIFKQDSCRLSRIEAVVHGSFSGVTKQNVMIDWMHLYETGNLVLLRKR